MAKLTCAECGVDTKPTGHMMGESYICKSCGDAKIDFSSKCDMCDGRGIVIKLGKDEWCDDCDGDGIIENTCQQMLEKLSKEEVLLKEAIDAVPSVAAK